MTTPSLSEQIRAVLDKSTKNYADRDAMALDANGDYIRHVGAMTHEALHSKSDIAAELAYRDVLLRQCLERIEAEPKEVAVIKDAVIDAAYDYRSYIIEDNAPMNLIDYMQKAIDAALSSLNQPEKGK
jgi:predicted NACHT family NTPase